MRQTPKSACTTRNNKTGSYQVKAKCRSDRLMICTLQVQPNHQITAQHQEMRCFLRNTSMLEHRLRVEFYMAIINIQQEKHKLVQGRQGIEGTGSLSSRCPSTVELALLLSSFNSWCCIYVRKSCEAHTFS